MAENYANTYRVSVDEANRRLGQLAEITRVEKALTERFPEKPDSNPFVIGGDSGGPVLIQNSAVGIIKGRGDTNFPNDMYFADILNIQAYGGFQYKMSP